MKESKSRRLKNFTCYTRQDYFVQLIEKVKVTKKGDRIAIATMAFEQSEKHIALLIEELCKAATRGVAVRCMVDSMAFMLVKSRIIGPLFYSKNIDAPSFKQFSDKKKLLDNLAACGGEYVVANRPIRRFSNPFSGRSHIKFGVINDDVYIGGCNLKEADRSDLMVHWQDSDIAEWLFKFVGTVKVSNRVSGAMNSTDITIPLDSLSTLLIDAGVKNQSIIFDNALRIIDEAEEYIVMSCQYFPNAKTVQRLALALDRGVNVRLIYNHPSKHSFPMNLLHGAVRFYEKRKYSDLLFKNRN